MRNLLASAALLFTLAARASLAADAARPLQIDWQKNILTLRGDFPGGPLAINYLEAYCRPGSSDRDWGETVIPHATEMLSSGEDPRVIKLRDKLADGVVVEHTITAGTDAVEFRVVAHNPTGQASQAHWAQPCIRVAQFTGSPTSDAHTLVPTYARKCFLFLEGKLARLPTEPWADKARYTPGQVYCPGNVDRNDVNPRPLSKLVPSSGLCGCFSADEKTILAVAWHPYQEIFQGVAACMHSDFRIGGLKPGETKRIRGKLYLVDANVDALVKRYQHDFPEQAAR